MRRGGLFVVVGILFAGYLLFNHLMGGISFVADKVGDHNNLQQKEIDIFLQMNSFLAGFSTLALGGIGALIWDRRNKKKNPTPQLLTAAGCSALSILFGYLSYHYLLWMLNHQFFDVNNPVVTTTSLLQFFAFFLSIVALTDFVLVTEEKELCP
jgi:hypothetical protein